MSSLGSFADSAISCFCIVPLRSPPAGRTGSGGTRCRWAGSHCTRWGHASPGMPAQAYESQPAAPRVPALMATSCRRVLHLCAADAGSEVPRVCCGSHDGPTCCRARPRPSEPPALALKLPGGCMRRAAVSAVLPSKQPAGMGSGKMQMHSKSAVRLLCSPAPKSISAACDPAAQRIPKFQI